MNEAEGHIEERVKKVLLNLKNAKLKMEPADIVRETPLIGKGLGLDSVAILNLVIKLEDEFDIVFDEAEMSIEIFENIGSLADYIGNKLQSC